MRKNFHLTQKKLASSIGFDASNISRYETGKYLILTACLYAICKKYQISADYLLGKTSHKFLKDL